MIETGSVLLTAVHAPILPSGVWEKVSQRRLVDCGRHVEWHDGAGVARWRLPDQPADPNLPLLAGISRILVPSQFIDSWAGTTVELIFTDPEGRFLARINTSSMRERKRARAGYPDEVFGALLARGVVLSEETIVSYAEFLRRHPGETGGKWRDLARRLAFGWL